MSKTLPLILLLSFLVVASLVGCGPQPTSVETPTPTPTPTASLPAPTQLTMLSIAEGEVFIMKSGTDSWLEAQVGTTLEPGDTIKAGDDSQAVITFFEGSTIELEAGTKIDVVTLNVATDTGSTAIKLKQEIGKTISRVEKLADPASAYEVETPAAVAVVRGTTMIIDVAIEGGTTIGCQNGTAWGLAKDVDVKVQINEGWQCSFEPGQLPGDLVPLSAPPDEDEDKGGSGRGRGSGGGGGGGSNGGGTQDITAIAITKTANTTQISAAHNITYTYEVTNPGDRPLSDVSVTDDKVSLVSYQSGDSDRDKRLDTNETWIFTASYTVGPDDPSPLVNTATAFGTDALGKTVRAQASASVTILLQPGLNITKTGDEVSKAGDNVTYSFFIENTGDSALNRTSVHDTVLGDITARFPATVASGANATVNVTYTVDATDPDPLVNNVTAIYHVPGLGNLVSANSTHSVDLLHPGLNITKTADCTTAYEGDEIIYTYNVTNTGDTPLSNISVIDDKAANANYQNGDANGDNKLDVGETWIFTANYTANYTASSNATGLLVNIATANGTDALGETVSAQASANVTILPYSIRIELTWDTDGTDIDAHFIRPGGAMWNPTDDCCFHNMNPDWGLAGVGVDNPSLDQDVISGYGPENTILRLPSQVGSYQYKVNYYKDFVGRGASTATVKIWIDGIKVDEYSKALSEGDTWNCASIDWPSGYVTPS